MSTFDALALINAAAEGTETAQGGFAKITSTGVYPAKIIEASFEKNKAGDKMQGRVKLEVTEGPKAGARMSSYFPIPKTDTQFHKNLIPYIKILRSYDVDTSELAKGVNSPAALIKNVMSKIQDFHLEGVEPKAAMVITKRDNGDGFNCNIASFEGATFRQDADEAEAQAPVISHETENIDAWVKP